MLSPVLTTKQLYCATLPHAARGTKNPLWAVLYPDLPEVDSFGRAEIFAICGNAKSRNSSTSFVRNARSRPAQRNAFLPAGEYGSRSRPGGRASGSCAPSPAFEQAANVVLYADHPRCCVV
eukprot:1415566-Rhodomonas_salina.1